LGLIFAQSFIKDGSFLSSINNPKQIWVNNSIFFGVSLENDLSKDWRDRDYECHFSGELYLVIQSFAINGILFLDNYLFF